MTLRAVLAAAWVGAASAVITVAGVAPVSAQPAREASGSAEVATARRLSAIRNQPLLLEAFLREMPKGGDLHNHLSGAIYAESYIRWAAEDKLCLVTATLTLDDRCVRRQRRPAGRGRGAPGFGALQRGD